MNLEDYFIQFKRRTIGENITNEDNIKLIYADWAASGRFYKDIEEEILNSIAPLYGNMHSKNTYIGNFIEQSYKNAKNIIKNHFGATNNYAVISIGAGMTAAVLKLQDIILNNTIDEISKTKPVVFITKYEHNSNYISWISKGIDVVIIDNNEFGQPDVNDFEFKLKENKDRKFKIASFSACSNITGIKIDLKPLVNKSKEYDLIVCIDFTAIAPYENIKISDFDEKIDAIVFSGHKFLGGVGGSGILIIKKSVYKCNTPTNVGGGVVQWVNPWGQIIYSDDLETREETGTPPIIQTIKTALAIKLKEKMGIEYIQKREEEIISLFFHKLKDVENIYIYDKQYQNRIGILSFNIKDINYNDVVHKLSEHYGIQTRGGCCCASIYAHELLNIDNKKSSEIVSRQRYNQEKFGFIRISTNPIMSDKEIIIICNAIKEIALG
ncbi:aminotransferase class V-fold PLP-dependent enzyme [Clostridium botulinum]|uniref:aminotransferase class V-fold PLP-dependent enzyme n=1 Tax=Clostridium botulinum TaxID=1491 RepID=UPI0007731A63|nr:aminotransferase class V-fold PLP-dependent enzyme [Clostridium botulinum]MBY6932199.1 aminotransferase class V-fold PLP-dependent enzyme [Clostridium botulinum]NFG21648.1 aminotransferase class V-fold PLP-dependent enzyme [Clostridium botulinum]NFO82286.1 aminotransferase class V-fold PLP-dependent enzyme [Clostridium botulinum]